MNNNLMIGALAATSFALSVHATELKVEIAGIEKTEGEVLVALYDESQFLKKPLKGLRIPVNGSRVEGSFGDVPEGTYALIAFHDENGNGKLDRNVLGMPIEKHGFSNDATGMMGPPEFVDAKFELNGAAKSVAINLR